MMKTYSTVESYLKQAPKEVLPKLKEMRQIIRVMAPKAEEKISYGMPGYKLNGRPFAYFAAFKSHIGFFPMPQGVAEFKKLTTKYKTSKGTIQFPLDQRLPIPLIKKILQFRLKAVAEETKVAKKKTK